MVRLIRLPGTPTIADVLPAMWRPSRKTVLDCMICMAMCGSGAMIGTGVTAVDLRLIHGVHHPARSVSFVVVAGTTFRRTFVRPFAATTRRIFGTTVLVSGASCPDRFLAGKPCQISARSSGKKARLQAETFFRYFPLAGFFFEVIGAAGRVRFKLFLHEKRLNHFVPYFSINSRRHFEPIFRS